MQVTQWKRKGKWELRQETITWWRVFSPRCDSRANYGYTEQEAITVAREEGWKDGLCPECWELSTQNSPDGLLR
jgi:hypothetical protein